MKKKLIAAMLLFATQVNGMDIVDSIGDRVDELEGYYQSQSSVEENKALKDLNEVFDESVRKTFFQKLISKDINVTNDKALLEFIRSAATAIIRSPEYSHESSSSDSEWDSPDFVYKSPFLFTLVESLDPITWHYIRMVKNQ